MHPDLEAIVAADVAARRDVDGVQETLAAREAAERARLQAAVEAAAAEARTRLEADVRAVESGGRAAVAARRAARDADRARRRDLAEKVKAAALAAYVRIVRGSSGPGAEL